MPTVRTTMRPDQDLVVDDREAYGLRQNGLLVDDDKAPQQDPSALHDPVDAEQAARDQNTARSQEQGEDKAPGRSRAKPKE